MFLNNSKHIKIFWGPCLLNLKNFSSKIPLGAFPSSIIQYTILYSKILKASCISDFGFFPISKYLRKKITPL